MLAINQFRKWAGWLGLGTVCALAASGAAQTPPAVLDVKPAFLLVATNVTLRTNVVIVTNYVVVTNITRVTNYYNAAGQLLTPVGPQATLPALPATPAPPPPKPAGPDPAQLKAAQVQALRDLLAQGVLAASNHLARPGAFTSNATTQIQIPSGLTAIDRKRSDALVQAMNLTAERAVPEAAVLLRKHAGQVQTDDPAAVVKGQADAATRLLLASQGEELAAGLVEIVRRAGTEPKLREAYSNVILRGGGLLGAVLGTQPQVDIEAHVAQGLLRALVERITQEEKTVRTDAAARKTKALQEAFGK